MMNIQDVKTPVRVIIQQTSQLQNMSHTRKSNFVLSGDRKRRLQEHIQNNSKKKIILETDGATPSTSGINIKYNRNIPEPIKIVKSGFVKQKYISKKMDEVPVNSRPLFVKKEEQRLPIATESLETEDITNKNIVKPKTITEMTCRACLIENSVLFPLESSVCVDKQTLPIVDILDSVTMQKVDLEEKYPGNLCVTCLQHVIAAYKWIKQYQTNQQTLNELCTPVGIKIHTMVNTKEEYLNHESISKSNTDNITNQINENVRDNAELIEAVLISDDESNMETNENINDDQMQRAFIENSNTYGNLNEVKSDVKNRVSVNDDANVKNVDVVNTDKKNRVTCKECVCSMDVLSVGNHILKCKLKENAYNINQKKYEMFICKHCSLLIQLSELVNHANTCFAKDSHTANLKENDHIVLKEKIDTSISKEDNERKDIAKQLLNLARRNDNIPTISLAVGSQKQTTNLDTNKKNSDTVMQSIRVKPMNELIGSAKYEESYTKVSTEGDESKNVSVDEMVNNAQTELKSTTATTESTVTSSVVDNIEIASVSNSSATGIQNENKNDSVQIKVRRRRKGGTKFTIRKRNSSKRTSRSEMWKKNDSSLDVTNEEEETKVTRSEKKAVPENGAVQCVFCFEIIKLSSIASHRKKCIKPKGSFPCTSCKTTFALPELLLKHQLKVHSKGINCFCTICNEDVPQSVWKDHCLKHNVDSIDGQSKSTESKGANEKNV